MRSVTRSTHQPWRTNRSIFTPVEAVVAQTPVEVFRNGTCLKVLSRQQWTCFVASTRWPRTASEESSPADASTSWWHLLALAQCITSGVDCEVDAEATRQESCSEPCHRRSGGAGGQYRRWRPAPLVYFAAYELQRQCQPCETEQCNAAACSVGLNSLRRRSAEEGRLNGASTRTQRTLALRGGGLETGDKN